MHYQPGNMRQLNYESTPAKNPLNSFQRDNQFHFAQKSKYQKSDVSYPQQPKYKVYYNHYEGERTDRFATNSTLDFNDEGHVVKVKLRIQGREDHYRSLRVVVANTSEKNNQSMIIVNITDDTNSLFLWSFYIRECDYPTLKQQLNLRVEFSIFPQMITDHLNLVHDAEHETNETHFYALLDIKKNNEEAEFKILQTNKYKQSEQLCLRFKKANDQELKKYLGSKYDFEKKEAQKLRLQISHSQSELEKLKGEQECLIYQFENYKKQSEQKIEQLEKKQRNQKASMKRKIEQEYESKRSQQAKASEQKIEELNQQLKQSRKGHEHIYNKLQASESEKIELQSKYNRLESETKQLRQRVTSSETNNEQLKARNVKLNEEYFNLTNENTRLTCNINNLEQKIKQKQQRLSQNLQVKNSNMGQITTLEQNLKQEKKKNEKLEFKIENLQEEVAKLNEENCQVTHRYEKKKKTINEAKVILHEKEEENRAQEICIQQLKQAVKAEKERVGSMQAEIAKRDKDIRALKQRVEEGSIKIEEQRKFISTLHKQTNNNYQHHLTNAPRNYPTGYNPLSSTISRELPTSTYTSSTSSRIKMTETSPLLERGEREQLSMAPPPIKRYQGGPSGSENEKNRTNSKSPTLNRLSQQVDPEEKVEKPKVGPVKFRRE